jgi:hypothetical protein
MRIKIPLGLGTIIAALVLVTGVIYAYFTSNAVKVSGVTLASATPVLKIWNGSSYTTEAIAGNSASNLYPGWVSSEESFSLKNESGGAVPFAQVIPTVTSESGDWESLKEVIEARFAEEGIWGDWQTLAAWNTNSEVGILASALADGSSRTFSLQYRMSVAAGDSAKGKTLFGLQWDFVGRTP